MAASAGESSGGPADDGGAGFGVEGDRGGKDGGWVGPRHVVLPDVHGVACAVAFAGRLGQGGGEVGAEGGREGGILVSPFL